MVTVVLTSAFLSSCSMQAKFTYPLAGSVEVVNREPPDVKIAVIPARDLRETENNMGTWFLYLIPLMPYGWCEYNRPEASRMFFSIASFELDVKEDVAKAIAEHLQQAGLAKRVFFDYGGLVETADYVLETDVKRSTYRGKVISYGLSAYGPLLWFFGLPGGTSRVELEIDMRMRNRSGTEVWSHTLTGNSRVVQSLYYNMGEDMEGVAVSLQEGLEKMMRTDCPPVVADAHE